ncbi:MAG: 50S ribosomal protein L20 [Patescibacteria group bacterium]|jgi:large subunit ribosomal protein L20|nr:50S ribosomal protein L20 [Patescibacteria group bacterium]
MPRVKRGATHNKKRRNLLKQVKGYRGGRKKLIRQAKTAVKKAGAYSYRDRRNKKRTTRSLWQININSACRQLETTYSKFIDNLKKNKIELDRKVLADLAENEPKVFEQLIKQVTPKK